MDDILRALLAVVIADREERLGAAPRRTELVLAGAGLSIQEIAQLTNKNYEAVKKALQRAKRQSNGSETDAAEN